MSFFKKMEESIKKTVDQAEAQVKKVSEDARVNALKNLDHAEAQIRKVSEHARAEVIGRWNPNRRHDDPEEIAQDKIRAEINAGHRFNSFAGERSNNDVKWHIDGHDYMWALSEMLENAKEVIFIMDWWLTPELYLRRPPAYYPEWRLDRILKRKAEQGVKVHVIVYKEVWPILLLISSETN
ncbi:hypothetical protein H0H93_004105 [Arthromyces matolae]|nr:hypothetical protein H0H93_004105 [Arthromyces matolae]